MAEPIDLLVRPVGIEPTTLSLEEPPTDSAMDDDKVRESYPSIDPALSVPNTVMD
jgi:hypothetical protein